MQGVEEGGTGSPAEPHTCSPLIRPGGHRLAPSFFALAGLQLRVPEGKQPGLPTMAEARVS